MLSPQIDHCVRGRVVFLPRFPRNLLDEHFAHQGSQRPQAHQAIDKRCSSLGRLCRNQVHRHVTPAVLSGNTIEQADLQPLASVDGIASQHQLHAGTHATIVHGTYRATKPRMQTEFYFGQAQDTAVTVWPNAVITGHHQFQAAAEADAVDRRYCGAGKRLELVEQLLPKAGQIEGLFGRLDAREFGYVGAHYKAAGLAGVQNQAARWRRSHRIHYVVELHQDLG